jgi:hypothetical protein
VQQSPADPYLALGTDKYDTVLPFSGWLDELRFSNILRTRVDFPLSTAPYVNDINTAAIFHFDEGAGDVVYDTSGFGGGPSSARRVPTGSPSGQQWSVENPFAAWEGTATPSPTPSPTATITGTLSATPTATASKTPSPSPSASATTSPTRTVALRHLHRDPDRNVDRDVELDRDNDGDRDPEPCLNGDSLVLRYQNGESFNDTIHPRDGHRFAERNGDFNRSPDSHEHSFGHARRYALARRPQPRWPGQRGRLAVVR